MSISIIRAVETAGADLTNLDFTWRQSKMVMLGFSEPCLGIVCTCIILLRPVFLRFKGSVSRVFSGANQRLPPRFQLSMPSSVGRMTDTARGYFIVPIFLQTKWSSMKSSMKSGLSGVTVAFSTRNDNANDLDDWERQPGQDKGNRLQQSEMTVLTHPWQMDTFDKLKDGGVVHVRSRSSSSSMTYETIETVKRLQILKLDKPLPEVPDDDDGISGLDGRGHSPRGFG